MTKDERLYLENLSHKVYGSQSKYQKMLKGEKAPMEEILEDGTSRKYVGLHYSTVEEVKKIMEDLVKEDEESKARQELEAEALKQAAEIKKQAGQEEAMQTLADEAQKLNLGYENQAKEEKPHDTIKDILEIVGD